MTPCWSQRGRNLVGLGLGMLGMLDNLSKKLLEVLTVRPPLRPLNIKLSGIYRPRKNNNRSTVIKF